MVKNNLDRWHPLDTAIVTLVDALYQLIANDEINDISKKIINARSNILFNGNLGIYMRISTEVETRLLKFDGVFSDHNRVLDITDLYNGIHDNRSMCEIRWIEVPRGTNEYSDFIYTVRKIQVSLLDTSDANGHHFANFTYMVSILMSIQSMLQLLLLAFQDINPIPLSIKYSDFINTSCDVDDTLLLPYILSVRNYISYWSTKLYDFGWIRARVNGSIWNYKFSVGNGINLVKEYVKTNQNKSTSDMVIYSLSISLTDNWQIIDIIEDDECCGEYGDDPDEYEL